MPRSFGFVVDILRPACLCGEVTFESSACGQILFLDMGSVITSTDHLVLTVQHCFELVLGDKGKDLFELSSGEGSCFFAVRAVVSSFMLDH